MSEELYFEDVEIGDEIDTVERVVTPEQVKTFLSIRGHDPTGPTRFTDDAHARGEGLPGAIVPGAMNIAMVSQLLTGWSPTVTIKKLEVVFRKVVRHHTPVYLKGVVTATHVVDGEPQVECDVVMEDDEGDPHVIGHATLVLPWRPAGSQPNGPC